MTDVAFHFNVPQRLDYACRLLRKIVASGSRALVTAPPDTLEALDASMWTFSDTDFIAHCGVDAQAQVLQKSPVVLAQSTAQAPFYDILVNLGAPVASDVDRFARVIEVVTLDEEDRRLARQRWKRYADAGLTLVRHDLAAPQQR